MSSLKASGVVVSAVVLCLSAGFVLAQETGPTAPAGGGGATTAPTAPPTTTPTPTPTPTPGRMPSPSDRSQQPSIMDQQQPFPDIQRPIFLSGKVVLQDGTPPPDPAVIERVCNGIVRPEAYTDSKGRFSFQLGAQNNAMLADASVGGASDFDRFGGRNAGIGGWNSTSGISERDLWGCEIRASLPGYTSEAISLGGRRTLDNPELGTIVLRRYGNVEGTTVSMTSLQAPKDAKKAFDKGRDSMKKKKWADAGKQFQKAVDLYPKYAAAWTELGNSKMESGDRAGARAAYAKALEADPKYVNPYLQVATLDAQESKWQDLAAATSQVLRLDPFNYPTIYYYDAVAQFNLQHMDEAEKSAREALKLDPQHRIPSVNHLLGVILASKGEFEAAAGFLKTYLRLAPAARDASMAKQRLAEVEKVAQSQPGVAR
ncbi:MAG: tetratricopeptide repeat protein [Bryobacteraceae bacterium]